MPFTLAHPAAIIPLHKLMGRHASISALVIGSMTPDFIYFIPILPGEFTHSLLGIMLFCLPAGWLAYLLFHLFFKRPASMLLPRAIARRLPPLSRTGAALPETRWWVIALSIVLGAGTHVAWDMFTHANTIVVQNIDVLRIVVATFDSYTLYLFRVFQHASSIIGLLLLGWWIASWMKTAPVDLAYAGLSLRSRMLIFSGMAVVAVAGSLLKAFSVPPESIEHFAFRLVVGGLTGAGLTLFLFCIAWHVRFSDRRKER